MNASGYSVSSQSYILSLLHCNPSINLKVNYVNVGTKIGISQNRQQIFDSLSKKPNTSPRVNIYHSIPHLYRCSKSGDKNIGFCIFETIDPPKEWINMMNKMDGIITASEFNKNIFISSGLTKPVFVVPHCFDPKMFNEHIQPLGRYSPTTFLSIGTWKIRKNWEMLIKSWYDAFEKKDNVCLLIKTDKPKDLAVMISRIKRTESWRTKDTAPIYSEESPNCTFEQIPAIMKKADIYVSCSIGEGFNLPVAESMALKIPVITTRFGGTLEYAHPESCTYFEPKEYKRYPIMDGIPQFANKIWPVLTISEIRNKLRYVFQKREERNKKAQLAYEYVHNNLTYKVIGKKFLEAISQICPGAEF